jgi:hypothetical protein
MIGSARNVARGGKQVDLSALGRLAANDAGLFEHTSS